MTERETMLSSSGDVSSMRYAMLLCVKCSVGIAIFAIVGYFFCIFFDKQVDGGFFSGVALLITPFLTGGFVGKATQSFAEQKRGEK